MGHLHVDARDARMPAVDAPGHQARQLDAPVSARAHEGAAAVTLGAEGKENSLRTSLFS